MAEPDSSFLTDQLRTICLAFPEAIEQETWGHPTFRVRKKIFVGCGLDDDGRFTMSMKAAPGEQDVLLAEGHPFFMPKYVGSKGWIGVELDTNTEWPEIAELVEDSYRAIAPKTLVKMLDD
ncbi:MAG: MmcQ/YjbR family DNA-binding protein [Acidimicrobiales bacterium]